MYASYLDDKIANQRLLEIIKRKTGIVQIGIIV